MKWCSSKLFLPKLKWRLNPKSTVDLSQEWRRLNVFFMNNAYHTLWAQHTSAFPRSSGREMREGVSVRPHLPSGAVCACLFTGWSIVNST